VLNIINSVGLKSIVGKPLEAKKKSQKHSSESESESAKGSSDHEDPESPSPHKKSVKRRGTLINRSPSKLTI
jgi:hypothetical protein